jgi:hypothetical protein
MACDVTRSLLQLACQRETVRPSLARKPTLLPGDSQHRERSSVIAGTMVACRVSRATNLAEKLSDLPWEESSVLEAAKKIELAFFAGT